MGSLLIRVTKLGLDWWLPLALLIRATSQRFLRHFACNYHFVLLRPSRILLLWNMAKLLEIFALGIQNSKNVMFWSISRKFNKYRHKSFILPVTNSFSPFKPLFKWACYLNVVYKVADLPCDSINFPPDLHSTDPLYWGSRNARIGSSRVTDCFNATLKVEPQQIQRSHQRFSFH